MSSNIWEIVTIKDVVKILQENENKIIIMGLTIETSTNEQKKMIKNFLKLHHKDYKNVLYVYHCVSKKDIGRISLFKKETEQYPLLYYIYKQNIAITVTGANNKTLNESYDIAKKEILDDMDKFLNNFDPEYEKNNADNYGDEDTQTKNSNEKISSKIPTTPSSLNNTTNDININNVNNVSNDQNNNDENIELQILEQRKAFDKATLFKKLGQKYNIEFLQDIHDRKKIEEDKKYKDREERKLNENKKNK